MTKKILIVTHGFYPEQSPRAFRATELAKEFFRQGHEVSVMAPSRENITSFLKEFPISFIDMGVQKWKIPTLKRKNSIIDLINRILNRLLPWLFEFPMMELFFMIRSTFKKTNQSFDLVISVAFPYPIHWGIASIWTKYKSKNKSTLWIADCGDPYCLQENDSMKPPFYFRWIEKWFMRKADYITVPTSDSYLGYFPEFHAKLRVIPQGFRFQDIDKSSTIEDGIVRFGYGGTFIPGMRDPSAFLAYLTSLEGSIKFEFHIYTMQVNLINPYLFDHRIILHEPISRAELLKEFSTFQFVVNFSNKGKSQTPSKLIDYGIIEKPILQIDSHSIDNNLVDAFLHRNYDGALQLDNISDYQIENVAKKFLKLI